MSVILGLLTLYMIYRWVPNVEALPNKGMKAQFKFMRHRLPLAHHRSHFLRQWRHTLLVQLHLAFIAVERRVQCCQHFCTDDSCRIGYGGRQSGECLACR